MTTAIDLLTAVPLAAAAERSGLTATDILGLLAAPGEDPADAVVRCHAGDDGLLVSLGHVLQVAPALHYIDRMSEAELVTALAELEDCERHP